MNSKLYQFIKWSFLILILIFQSCANYKLNYTNEAKSWKQNTPSSDLKLRHSIYLVGDTGNIPLGETPPLFKLLKTRLSQETKNSSIIFLGNNIYPKGMPAKSKEKKRALAEHILNTQLDMLDDFKGEVIFIPGNLDWESGLKGLKRQEKYVEKNLNHKKGLEEEEEEDDWHEHFLPSNGCGDPQVVEINDQLVVIVLDSQWWLANWNKDKDINEGCDIKSRSFFKFQAEEVLRKHRNKNVVVAMHHPLFSNGTYGGNYTLKEHIFPLTQFNKNLYLPLPVVGTVAALFKRSMGLPQTLTNGKYKDMKSDILFGAKKNGNYIFVSAHETNLQYIAQEKQHFIISGSGSTESPAQVGNGGEFAYGRLGFSKLDFYEDGSAWVEFWAMTDDKTNVELVFKRKIKEKLKTAKDNIPTEFPEYEEQLTVKTRLPNNYNLKPVGWLHKASLGEHYLDAYLKSYPFEVLDLSTFKGGMTPIKRGGGNQTNSLRLQAANGKQFVMRSLTKDASRALPYPYNQISGAENILRDNFLSAYPFAALVVPPLADAAQVYHANPKLYYIPKQPALGYHNDLFGGDVYLVEERLGGNWEEQASLGNSKKIISTLDVSEKISKNHKHRVDHAWVVRSKLFDMLIKDWDRHDDQWRWASFEEEHGKYYRPIPRDRDQAFAKYDGFMMRFIGAVSPFYRQLQTYSPDMKDIRWASWNGKYFDTNFMGEADWKDWENAAKLIQTNVTDEIIEQGFLNVPEAARDEEWQTMVEYTKKRRDNIMKFARMAYEYNSEQVDVLGTEKRDLFEIERLSNTQTRIRAFVLTKEGEKGRQKYERSFDNKVTKEIHIYGLGGDDIFRISGEVDRSILIRILGGLGKDEIVDQSKVKLGRKKTLVYDFSTEKNKLDLGKEGKDKTSTNFARNTYDRKHPHYQPNFTLPLPVLGFNQDDGFLIGFDLTRFRYQFKKVPYGQSHRFRLDFATSPQAFNFNYDAVFNEALGTWDLTSKWIYRGDRFSFNYFGYGNESLNPNVNDLVFNRIRQSKVYADLQVSKTIFDGNAAFSFGPLIERTKMDNTTGRFITSDDFDITDEDLFEAKWYAGGIVKFSFENVNSIIDPHRGLKLHLAYNVETNLDNSDLTFGKFSVGFTAYRALDKQDRVVFATSLGYESISGEYDFFKAPAIGGGFGLRAFRIQRFRDDNVFFHNNDLRIKLFSSINKFFPFTLGIHGGFDYGRTWSDDDDESDVWHTSYGGGIWLAPVDAFVLSFGQYASKEDNRFIFKMGHQF